VARRSDWGLAVLIGIKITILFFILVLPVAHAATQTSFVLDAASPAFNFTESELSDGSSSQTFETSANPTLYIDIPAHAIINTVSIRLTGSSQDLGNTEYALDTQSGSNALFDNNEASGASERKESATFTGTFTVPENAVSFSHTSIVHPASNYGGRAEIWLYNHAKSGWNLVGRAYYSDTPTPYYLECANISLYPELLDDNNAITVQYVGTTHPDDTLRPPVLGKGHQKSSYKLEKTPYNPSLNISDISIWSFKGQFKDTDFVTLNSGDFRNTVQDYVNSCEAGTLCSVPFSFTAQTKGDITLDNINIEYTYSPSGVSTSPILNSTTITAGEESYIANLTSFDASTVQDITIGAYIIPIGASKCWENKPEQNIIDSACDIADFTWQTGKTASSIKVWSDTHDKVIPAANTSSAYSQNTSEITIAGGWAYIKQLVTLTNIIDVFQDALNINWLVEPKDGHVCTFCSGTEDGVGEVLSREVYANMKGSDIITKNEVAPWIEQPGGHTLDQQNMQKAITGENTGLISYSNVYWELSSLDGYVGDTTSGTIDLEPLEGYTVTVTAHTDALENTSTDWTQSGTATLGSQVIESNLSVENKDDVEFTGVAWNKDGTKEFPTCEKCSGSFTIEPNESLSIMAKYSGDALVEENWTEWGQQEAKLDGTVEVKTARDVENTDIVPFSGVDTEILSKEDWSCSGDFTITIPAGQKVTAESTCINSEGLVSLEAADWRQDSGQAMTIDSTAYIEGRAQGQNTLDEDIMNIQYDNSNAEAQCKAEWDCTIGESYTDLSILAENTGIANGYNVKAEKEGIVISVNDGNNDWKQNTGETTVAGATAYVRGNLKASNIENINFNNVIFSANTDSQYRDGWSCSHEEQSFNIAAITPWTSDNYPILCTKDNIITKSPGVRAQDTDKDSTLSVQYAKKPYTLKNTDIIDYSFISWEGTNDWGECDKCSNSIGLKSGENTVENVEWHGDILIESWNEWEQDLERNNNLSNQHLVRTLTVVNKDDMPFEEVVWENQTKPEQFTCDQCNGMLGIKELDTTSEILLANGDALNDTLSEDWIDGPAEAGGFATISKDLRIENLNGKIGFKEIVLNLDGRNEWSCTSVERVNISAGEIVVIQDAIKCFKENVVEKSEAKPVVSNKTIVNVGENLDILKTVTLTNVDGMVEYNASVKTSVLEAFENSVSVRTIENQLVQPDVVDYIKGVVDWSVLITSGSITEYKIEYKVSGPYYSSIYEQSSQAGVALYEYFANITIPNNYSERISINAPISISKFLDWDKHNGLKVLVDDEAVEYKITEDTIVAVISNKEAGVKELQISYTVPSIELNTTKEKSNETSIKVEINGKEDSGNTTFEGVKNVCIKSQNETVTCFEYNFSENILDLQSFEAETIKTTLGGRVLRGFSLQKSQTKTVLVPKLTNSNKVCIVDREVQDISEVVCNGTNNTYEITCNGQEQHNYTCTSNSTYYTVTGLKHSGIQELPELKPHKSDGDSSPSNNPGGSGGSPSFRTVKKTPVEENNKVEIQSEETKLVNLPFFETQEKEKGLLQTSLSQSKATGFLNLISLKTLQGKIISAVLLGLLIAVFIGARVDKLKFPKIHVPHSKPSPLKSELKTQNITNESQSKLNNHMQTILKALHPREEEIMKTLMDYNGHATQARIYHATGIPTTSLSRWVDSLERRELVESTRRGKLRDLKVTDKFKGK